MCATATGIDYSAPFPERVLKEARMPLAAGDSAPDFTLTADDGETVALGDLRGSRVVIYFYPKDDTPGCTKQACALRDDWGSFENLNTKVFGISPDSVESHEKFRTKYSLPFQLLADPDHAVADSYEVWGEKKNYGKTYMGTARRTFLVDPDGRIAKTWEKVKPEGHAADVLAALDTLQASRAG
jgi:peroxiredoxin Q/BCP